MAAVDAAQYVARFEATAKTLDGKQWLVVADGGTQLADLDNDEDIWQCISQVKSSAEAL